MRLTARKLGLSFTKQFSALIKRGQMFLGTDVGIIQSFPHNPLVSVLIVTHNSRRDIENLCKALNCQVYDNFEVIVVDNSSTDDTAEHIRNTFKTFNHPFTIYDSTVNTGFAGGCNKALQYSRGELIALLNTDATPEPEWLLELVHALRLNTWAAVATPKVLFNGYFKRVILSLPAPGKISLPVLLQSFPYPKIFVRHGMQDGTSFLQTDECNKVVIDIPSDSTVLDLHISFDTKYLEALAKDVSHLELGVSTETSTTYEKIEVFPIRKWYYIKVLIPKDAPTFRVINNAGSTSGRFVDKPRDIGFGNIDCAYYDHPVKVNRLCGCAPLIRRAAFVDRDLFVDEFFAYYEDSELSRWLISKRRGGILYWPRARVSHFHSSTLGEKSPTWEYLTQRSWLLYKRLGLKRKRVDSKEISSLKLQLDSLASHARTNLVPASVLDLLRSRDKSFLCSLEGTNKQPSVNKKPIAIYNLYWNTRGGGEIHALAVAAYLRTHYKDREIYLISETDFDIEALGQYFAIDTYGLRKLVVDRVTSELTERFWLFVNSTSHSSLVSRACNSWYIVSFPHKTIFRGWLKNYDLLCNSEYTKYWCLRRWGAKNAHVVYPLLQLKVVDLRYCTNLSATKRPNIVSVGRFTLRGHAKNQHRIINAFSRACELSHGINDEWRLVLAGSLDKSNIDDCNYFADLQKQISLCKFGCRITLVADMSRENLVQTLEESLVYVHATGLGANSKKPELQEHFGIAPVEAAMRGCIPLVFNNAGPAEVIRKTRAGITFIDETDMGNQLGELMTSPLEEVIQRSIETARSTMKWTVANQSLPFHLLANTEDS